MGVYWQQLNTFDIERRNQSRLVAEGLRQTADQLTRLAQAYIGTKNPVHVQNYLVIREILDDKRTLTDSVALPAAFQGMPPLALTEASFRKLARDQPGATTVTATELAAMALVDTVDSNLDARRIQANNMLGDARYQKLKSGLVQPTRQYLELVDRRTQLAVTGIDKRIAVAAGIFLLLGLILLLLFWRTLTVLRSALYESLNAVHAAVAQLANRNAAGDIALQRAEIAVGWWARTQRQLSQIMTVTLASESRLKQLLRLNATQRHFNQAVLHSTSEKEIFEKICWAAVVHGGMKMAWVGVMDPQTQHIQPIASFGDGAEHLQAVELSVEVSARPGSTITSTAFRQGQAIWCQDVQKDFYKASQPTSGASFTWVAGAALPLRRDNLVMGVLTVYADEINVFDQPVREQLLDMVLDADYALKIIQRETERALRQSQRARTRQKDGLRSFMVERLTSDVTLDQILEDFVLEIEKQFPDAQCSILLLDTDGQHLAVRAAPTLPDFFNEAINGLFFEPHTERCGTTACADQRVIVEDIASQPGKAGFKELAAKAGVVSCWSEPIRSGSQQVLGTLTLYHRTPGKPTPWEIEVIEMVASLTAFAVERKRTATQLQLAANVFEQGSEAIVVTDAVGRIVRVNHAFTHITGYGEAEAIGRNANMLSSGRHDASFFNAMWTSLHTRGQWQGEIWNKKKSGAIYPERLSISVLRDGSGAIANYVAIGTDITKHKNDEKHMRLLVDFDPLTGLPNRACLAHRVENELLTEKHQGAFALMLLDLDKFKNVNDSLGHSVGDELLIKIAQRLQRMLGDTNTMYRLGGDKFVVLCPGLGATAAAQLANQVLEATAQGDCIGSHDLVTTLSIGISLYPADGDSLETLSMNAENAMYQAKQRGRGTYRFFAACMLTQSSRTLQLENGLRRALELKQLHLVYQPQVSLDDGRIFGMEALLRWEHPTLGTVAPSEFIPIAEDSGLILSIGEWVLRTATKQMRSWVNAGLNMQLISVNLSVVQFRHLNLPGLIKEILLDANLPPHYLELELTESVAMGDPLDAIAVMDNLARCGVRLSIDDFGTGYSSLSYLKRFSIHKLKIDQSFVRHITDDPDDRAIVVAIIALARSMGFKTLAEGVETQGQRDLLQAQGCDEVQGYFYSAPLLPAAFEAFVRQHQSP